MELDGLLCSCNARSRMTLARVTGTSREIDCKAIGGVAGEKCLPVGGRVRKLRAVGEQSSPPSRKQMEERCSFDTRNEGQSGRFSFFRTAEYQGVVDYLTPLKYRSCF
jgi:hypothetical protein